MLQKKSSLTTVAQIKKEVNFVWIMHFILYGHLNCLWDIFVLRKRIVDNHMDTPFFFLSICMTTLITTPLPPHPYGEYFQISDQRSRRIFYIRADQIDIANKLENNEYSMFSQKINM